MSQHLYIDSKGRLTDPPDALSQDEHDRRAPVINCDLCGLRIAKNRLHVLLPEHRVACTKCIDERDLYGQTEGTATRAMAARWQSA